MMIEMYIHYVDMENCRTEGVSLSLPLLYLKQKVIVIYRDSDGVNIIERDFIFTPKFK